MNPTDKTVQVHDVIVRFNTDQQELVVYSAQATETLTNNTDDGNDNDTTPHWKEAVRLSTAFFASKTPQESERTLGALVFALLNKQREAQEQASALHIRNYAERAKQAKTELNKELLDAATAGDAEAQYLLFVEHHSTAIMQRNADELELAEVMLNASADAGYEEAIGVLKDWSDMKDQARKRIAYYLEHE